MKVVYIPVILPIIKRTLVSITLLVISTALLTAGLGYGRWISVSYERVGTPGEYLSDGSLMTMYVQQGLQDVELRTCYHVVDFATPMCLSRSVIYSFCKEKDMWCAGKWKFTAAYVCFIIAVVGGVIAFIVAFLNEKVAGPVALVANLLCGVIGTLLFESGQTEIHDRVFANSIQKISFMTKTVKTDISFHLCLAGICVGSLAGFICSTVLCCASKSNSERETAHIQVVNMNIGSGTSIAAAAPRPGFVRIGGRHGRREEIDNAFSIGQGDTDDDTELDLITYTTNDSIKRDPIVTEKDKHDPQSPSSAKDGEAAIPHSSSNQRKSSSSSPPSSRAMSPPSAVIKANVSPVVSQTADCTNNTEDDGSVAVSKE